MTVDSGPLPSSIKILNKSNPMGRTIVKTQRHGAS